MKADVDMPTTFMKVVGRNALHVSTQSTIEYSSGNPTEVVMALDITGSMAVELTPGGGTKYYGLVTAANHFLSVLSDANTANNIYVGIVPYTQTVNIGVRNVNSLPNCSAGTPAAAPTWNTGNTWLDSADPALSYDWGDANVTGYSVAYWYYDGNNTTAPFYGTVAPGWNRPGSFNPAGWGGCVMARRPDVNGTNGLELDISDDPPSVAPFQRFYYPPDNNPAQLQYWDNAGNHYDVNQIDYPCSMCGDPGTSTEVVTAPSHLETGTSCSGGDGSVCWSYSYYTANPGTYTHASCAYNSFNGGQNPWKCKGKAGAGALAHMIHVVSENPNIYPNDKEHNNELNMGALRSVMGPNYTCPMTTDNAPISIYPLQPAQDQGLVGVINSINLADQNTNYSNATTIDIGLVWAWRLVSSRWAHLWNDAVDATDVNWRGHPPANLKKYVIIMTDGQNNMVNTQPVYGSLFGQYGYTAYGLQSPYGVNPNVAATSVSTSPAPPDSTYLDNKTLTLCNAMRSEGITIYVVGFGTVGTGTSTDVNSSLLTSCAGSASHFFLASDNTALDAVFQTIAKGILQNLRVTH